MEVSIKTGQVFLLMGCPRTGKTTLSMRLVKSGFNFTRMSGDHLNTFVGDADVQTFDFTALIREMIDDSEAFGVNTVFDCSSYDFPLDQVDSLPFKDKLVIYFLGFPDVTPGEIMQILRKYSKPRDWQNNVGDDQLLRSAGYIFEMNAKLMAFCAEKGYRFINTGIGADRDIVLDMLFDEIIGQLFAGGSDNASTYNDHF